MYYVLLSSTGNMIDSYNEERVAHAALQRIVDAEPGAVEDVALMTYGEDGRLVGEPVFARAPTSIS